MEIIKSPYIIAAAVLILAVIFYFLGNKNRRPQYPYVKADNLLTKNERGCYKYLRRFADSHNYDLLCKVRLADIILVEKNTPDYMKWFNKIKSKHIDFVLCEKYKTDPILLIELDDPSHERADRIERDRFVDDICGVCGIDIVHIYRDDFNSLEEILTNIL